MFDLVLGEKEMATEKFKALVHFMVHQCREQPGRLGAIRLNKALWYTDVFAYKASGASVTGERYVKRAKGPVPARILQTLNELELEQKIHIREPDGKFDSRKFMGLVSPNTSVLSEDEMAAASSTLEAVCGYSANEISELTHDIIWEAAAEGEEIPLYATLVSEKGEISDNVRAWASAIVGSRANNGQMETA